ncbi:MAG: hypothetical protein R3D00_28275 [Bacteroidia bacterium]
MRLFGIILAGLLLTGCVFDEDVRFIPETQTGFILNRQAATKSVIKITGDIAETHWLAYPGMGEISDFSGSEKTIWFAEAMAHKIFEYDPGSQGVVQSLETQSLTPHFICAGEKVILLSDSAADQIGFFRLKNQQLTIVGTEYKPGQAVYRSGKFYVQAGDKTVDIYDELAYASIGTAIFDHAIKSIEADARSRIFVHTTEGNNAWQGLIDYNSNSISKPEAAVNYEKVRYTPYVERPLGKEYLRDVQKINGKLNTAVTQACSDFEVDFFESIIYFLRQDSLYSLKIADNLVRPLAPLDGEFQKAWYFIEEIP